MEDRVARHEGLGGGPARATGGGRVSARGGKGDRKGAILDAAIKVISRRGVRGLRVEQVAAEAGVAVSLIYYYFTNRNGLVRSTLDHANERVATKGADSVEAILLAELDEAAHDTSVVWGEVLASAV